MNKLKLIKTDLFRPIFFLLLAVLTIATLISCGKDPVLEDPVKDPVEEPDPIVDPTPEILITHVPDLYNGDISGKVLNENLEALAGVSIDIRGEVVLTDENGYFNLRGIQLDAQGTLVIASLENYWTISKMVSLSKNQQNQTHIVLLPKTEIRNVEASSGGMVNFSERVKIDFPTNAFVTSTGVSYDGEVEVAAVHLDPDAANFGMMSPGDFRAFNTDSELQSLLSLGMAGVELRGSNNEILELKSDKSAILSIKVPEGSNVNEVPLWHFDEASGYWLEEGMAKREGDFYVGEVSHFSWWNCDVPFSAVKLSGAVANENGLGIAGLPVTILLADEEQDLGREYTGGEGLFCGWIPKGENLIMQIRNECGTVFFEEAIGPFSEDTDLGEITVTGQNVIEVCGNLVNCDDEVVSDGYIVVQYDGNKTFIPVDEAGDFCAAVNVCEATTIDLYGIDLTGGLQGLVLNYDLMIDPVNDLNLSACDQFATFFRFQIDNEPEVLISDFTINLNTNGVIGFGAASEINGIFPRVIVDGVDWGASDFEFGYYNVWIASASSEIECEFGTCVKPNVEIVEYGGIGQPIILKITGTSFDSQDYLINVSGILEEF